jgi:CheY-like chemotaxis protein
MPEKSFKMLYVEDDDILREVLADEFSSLGIEIHCASGALDALEFLKANTVDAVVTDMRMPGIDGGGLKQLADSQLPNSPKLWVVLSAFSDRPLDDFHKLGFKEVFFKPFKPKLIVHYLRQALGLL